jgi:tetratricopeptide (TPR) repeat protein
MLGADVGQAAAVRTVSSARIQQILHDLAVPADGAIDPATLRRLAEFSTADTLVWGQYVKVDNRIRIDATLQNIKESRSVRLKTEVTTEKDVLGAVDRLARSIRAAVTTSPDVLGELRAQAFKPSSSSMPAVRAYNEGVALARRGNYQDAAKRLAESVRADPAFALAYSQLALSYSNLGQDDQAEDASRRAVELAAGLPQRERYLVEANHARVINDNQKAIEAYERLARVSPDDPDVQFALAGLYEGVGALQRAESGYANVLVRDPKQVDGLLALGRVQIKRRDPLASLEHLNRALTLAIELGDIEQKARVLHTIGIAYKRLNKPDDALRYYQEALAIRRGIGQNNGIAATLSEVADVQKTLGHPAEALASYNEALHLQRQIGDRRGAGMTGLNLGAFLMQRGAYEEALKLFRESLQAHRDLGNENAQSQCLNNIGAVYYSTGQYEDAVTYFQQALVLREKLKVAPDIAETVHNLGEASARIGQYDEAISRYLRALDLYRDAGDTLNVGIESDAIGSVFETQGRYGAALKVKSEALEHVRKSGESGYWMATVLGGYAHTLTLLGRAREAEEPLAQALAIGRGLGNRALVAQTLVFQGDRLYYTGDHRGAGALYRQAVESASGLSDRRLQFLARLGQARVAVESGKSATAVTSLKVMSAQAAEMGLKDIVAECALYLGQAALSRKDLAAARRQLEDALSRGERLGMRALLTRSHYLLALAGRQAGEDADAARHLAEARRLLADMAKDAKTDSVATRSDLAPIRAAGAQ